MRGLFRQHRNGLNAGRSRADDSNSFSREINPFMGPVAGVICGALEIRQTVEFRRLRGGDAARRHDTELRRDGFALVRRDLPTVRCFEKMGGRDGGFEFNAPPQIETVGHMSGIF